MTYGLSLIRKIVLRKSVPKWFRQTIQIQDTLGVKNIWTIYVACFTGNPTTAMWNDYAGGGTGGALVFDQEKLFARAATGGEYALFPILYDASQQTEIVSKLVDHAIYDLALDGNDRKGWFEVLFSLVGCAARFKDPRWASEREYRLGVWSHEGLDPFDAGGKMRIRLELSPDALTRVVRGPNSGEELSQSSLQQLLRQFGNPLVPVESAEVQDAVPSA